ncbi:MAG: hypothetical protein C4297_08475 [Gemmataceae bacterium]
MSQSDRDYTPYQRQVIRRYYANQPTLLRQRLAELVSELYLADEKKKDRLWQKAAKTLQQLGISQRRIAHILSQRKPELLAHLVTELS